MPIKLNFFIPLALMLAFTFCRQADPKKDKTEEEKSNTQSHPAPPGYDLEHPLKLNLQSELDEISGILYYPKDTSVFAVCDDKGWLYKIHLTGKLQVEKWKFSKGEDFEDLVLKDSTFYALASSGQITAFKFAANQPSASNTYSLNLDGINEFETLYADSASGNLITICKSCEGDSKKSVSAFSFRAFFFNVLKFGCLLFKFNRNCREAWFR